MHLPKKYQFSQMREHPVEERQHWILGRMSGTLYVTKNEKSSCVECNPVEEGGLLHSLWGRRCVANASRIAEGSGKDRDSFSFDFRVVAPVIFPPWGPLPGPAPDKLQSSIIQFLPLQSCHRAHSLIIPVFSLWREGPISGTKHWRGGSSGDTRVRTDVSGYRATTDKMTEMFSVSLAVCASVDVAMQNAGSETNGSVQDTEAAMRRDASDIKARFLYFVFIKDLFRNLTSSRMELNFEPNSSVLSCATVRGEKNRQKNAEKRWKQEKTVFGKVIVIATGRLGEVPSTTSSQGSKWGG